MIEQIYLKLPFALQNLLISLNGFFLKLRRGKKVEIENIEYISNREEAINNNLKNVFNNCLQSTYWSEIIKKHGVNIESNNLILELKKLPLSDKSEVVKNHDSIFVKQDGLISLKTSGTTGAGLKFTSTEQAEAVMWHLFDRYRSRFGINSDDWCGYFCGRTIKLVDDNSSPNWRINYAGKQILFSNYHLNNKSIFGYIEYLNKKKPAWIHGYPSFLNILAKLALENNLELSYIPKAITLGSESVSSEQKKLIEKFFLVRPSELYCQTEGVAMISECEYGRLHVDEEFSFVEFIPLSDQPNLFYIVGTSYFNNSFQFVRYKTGDIVELDFDKCKCGRTSRLIKSIDGRKEDFIELNNGVKVGRLDHIFKDMINIREAQIIQHKNLSITFNIVKNRDYNIDDERKLIKEIENRISNKAEYRVQYVNGIKRTNNGKLRFVVKEYD